MLKKLFVTGAALALGGMLYFGTSAHSYVSTGWGRFSETVQDSVPVEFEIDRARQMVRDLIPQIKKHMHTIAKEEVAVQNLDAQINTAEEKLAKDRADLGKLKNDLAAGKDNYRYGGRTYTVSQVKNDLANRFERFKTADATLGSLKDILSARQKSLDAARAKLEGMLVAKRQLEAEVENLDARLKMVELAQTNNEYNLDDSQLGHVRELIASLRGRLQVAEKLAQTEFHTDGIGEITVSEEVPADLLDQVAEYLGEKAPANTIAEVSTTSEQK
ncbi:MAG: hypothetical protein SFX18_07455 [Pirellulales bacterium]|nr:hypothetical protein [Pirellulales bacterium]